MDFYSMSGIILDLAIEAALIINIIIILKNKKNKNSYILLTMDLLIFVYFINNMVLNLSLESEILFVSWKISTILLLFLFTLGIFIAQNNCLTQLKRNFFINILFFIEPTILSFFLVFFVKQPTSMNIFNFANHGIISLNFINLKYLFFGHSFYFFAIVFYSIYLLFKDIGNTNKLFKYRNLLIGISLMIPLLFYIFDISRARIIDFKLFTPYALAIEIFCISFIVNTSRTVQIPSITHKIIIENMNDGLIVLDNKRRIIEINPQAQRILNCPMDWGLGQPLIQISKDLDFATKDSRDINLPQEIKLDQDKEPKTYRITFSKLNLYSNTLGTLIFLRDITNNLEINNELRQSKKSYRAIFTQATDAILMCNNKQEIIDSNPASSKLLGYSSESFKSLKMNTILDLHGLNVNLDSKNFERENKFFEAEFTHQNNTIIPVELTISKMSKDGVTTFLYIIRDITTRKIYESNMEKAQHNAEEANRAKSTFLANMSHELRTPLNAIIGMAGILKNTELQPRQLDYLKTLQFSSDTLLNLLNDILDISKIEAKKMELEKKPFILRYCMENAIKITLPYIEGKRIDLGFYIDPKVPDCIIGDRYRLRQILLNLLSNSVKFTREGEISITCSRQEQKGSECTLKFTVQDDGIGIPDKNRKNIFNSFNQGDASTTREYGGSGLGLAICKEICELMGGEIWIEKTTEKGTSFNFTIQVEENPMTDAEPFLRVPVKELLSKNYVAIIKGKITTLSLRSLLNRFGMKGSFFSNIPLLSDKILKENLSHIFTESTTFNSNRSFFLQDRFKNIRIIILESPDSLVDQALAPNIFQIRTPLSIQNLYHSITTENNRTLETSKKNDNLLIEKTSFPQIKILLAEDNKTNQKVELILLKRMGYNADLAENGKRVVEMVQKKDYDIILMDDHMPEMDGVKTTLWLRNHLKTEKQPYIIALTANALVNNKDYYLNLGMNDYISKPINLDHFKKAIEKGCRKRTQKSSLNVSKIIELKEFLSSDEEFLELITDFFNDATQILSKMKTAVKNNDHKQLNILAHTLKSTSMQLGGEELSHLCLNMEIKSKEGLIQDRQFDQIEEEFIQLKKEIEEYFVRN